MVFLAQHGVSVPDAWIWVQPRRVDDLRDPLLVLGNKIILRGSEPIECAPQVVSGGYPSQVVHLNGLGSELNSWLAAAYPVIVQRYVEAAFGGAAHVMLIEGTKVLIHLSWSSDVACIMDGSDSGMEVWLGDLPAFEEGGSPVLIARSDQVPYELVNSGLGIEFLSQMRTLVNASSLPFEVEWIMDSRRRLVFLQHLSLVNVENALEAPWVHADASVYAIEK
jgi:hypothetical protein